MIRNELAILFFSVSGSGRVVINRKIAQKTMLNLDPWCNFSFNFCCSIHRKHNTLTFLILTSFNLTDQCIFFFLIHFWPYYVKIFLQIEGHVIILFHFFYFFMIRLQHHIYQIDHLKLQCII